MNTILKVLGLLILFVIRLSFMTVYVCTLANLSGAKAVIDFYGIMNPFSIVLIVGIIALSSLLDEATVKFYKFLNKRV